MSKEKKIIRHEILNLLTLVNFSVYSLNVDKDEKKDLCNQLKLITLLISHEDVLRGEKRKILNRRIQLFDVFSILMATFEAEIQSSQLSFSKTDMSIFCDTTILKEGIENIIRLAMTFPGKVEIIAQDNDGSILINYNSKSKLDGPKGNLIELLEYRENIPQIPYQIGLHMMKQGNIDATFGNGWVKLKLPLA